MARLKSTYPHRLQVFVKNIYRFSIVAFMHTLTDGYNPGEE